MRFVSVSDCFKVKENTVLDIALTPLFCEPLISILAMPGNNENHINPFAKEGEKYMESATCTCY